MKAKLLLALFAISSVAVAQQRQVYREQGRQQNDRYASSFSQSKIDFSKLQLDSRQRYALLNLLELKEKEASVLRRNYLRADKQLARLESDYDKKIARLLSKRQYSSWIRFYAQAYDITLNSYRYV